MFQRQLSFANRSLESWDFIPTYAGKITIQARDCLLTRLHLAMGRIRRWNAKSIGVPFSEVNSALALLAKYGLIEFNNAPSVR